MFILKYIFITCLLYANLATALKEKKYYNISQSSQLFADFVQKFAKKYATEEEYTRRFEIFKENLENINRKNEESKTAVFGINQFTDKYKVELGGRKFTGLGKIINGRRSNSINRKVRLRGNIPDEWDWRQEKVVTPVKDQGYCGSCYVFCSIGAIESQYAMKYKKLLRLSEQQLLDCSGSESGCDGGAPDEVIYKTTKFGGVVAESDYPYKARKGPCKVKGKKKVVKVKEAIVHDDVDEEYLKLLVYKEGPIVVGMQTGFGFLEYEGGIATGRDFDCLKNELDHGVLIVGYGVENKNPYWIVKNSYSSEWGEDGYFRMKRGENACNITEYVVQAVII